MSFPKVVISIPTYNQEKYIGRAIKSALQQTYGNVHINVCDDSSTDRTWSECLSFKTEPRISIFKNDANIGRVKTYKKLFYELGASADWIVNLDGDDYFADPDFIERAIKTINSCSCKEQIVLYHAQFDLFPFRNKYLKIIDKSTYLIDGKDYVAFRPLVKKFYHFAALVNRQKAIGTNFYSYPSLNTDALSIQELALRGNVIINKCCIGVWKLHDNSETNRALDTEELKRYQDANDNFISLVQTSLDHERMLTYKKNISLVTSKNEIVLLLKNRNYLMGIYRVIRNPFLVLNFGRELFRAMF